MRVDPFTNPQSLTLEVEIIHEYQTLRKTPREIARLRKMTIDQVYWILRRNNIPRDMPGGSKAIGDVVVTQVLERYAAGSGATTIARDLGIDKKTVYNTLRRSGVQTRKRLKS